MIATQQWSMSRFDIFFIFFPLQFVGGPVVALESKPMPPTTLIFRLLFYISLILLSFFHFTSILIPLVFSGPARNIHMFHLYFS